MKPLRTALHPFAPVFLSIVSLMCSWLGGEAGGATELPPDVTKEIGILSQYKSNAEQQARILVGLAAEHDITKEDYRIGQSLYAEAKAAFDGWIDQLIFEVQSPKKWKLNEQCNDGL